MPDYVLIAVLFAAFLHALWNALIRHSQDQPLYTLSLHLCSAVLAVPVLWAIGLPSLASAPYLLASVLLHGLYIYLLAKVYASGPFATSYILMRGTAPVFVMFISFGYLDAGADGGTVLGVALLAAGLCFLLYAYDQAPLRHLKSKQVRMALANAVVIAAYTVVDGLGARASGNPVAYVFAAALFEPVLVYYFGFRKRSAALWLFFTNNMRLVMLGSVISLAGYSIVLWAMTLAPIAVVSGLRETSVFFAALLAVFWFKEGRWLPVMLSSLVVFLGIFLLKA